MNIQRKVCTNHNLLKVYVIKKKPLWVYHTSTRVENKVLIPKKCFQRRMETFLGHNNIKCYNITSLEVIWLGCIVIRNTLQVIKLMAISQVTDIHCNLMKEQWNSECSYLVMFMMSNYMKGSMAKTDGTGGRRDKLMKIQETEWLIFSFNFCFWFVDLCQIWYVYCSYLLWWKNMIIHL